MENLLISVHTKPVSLIINGSKTIELRKVRPKRLREGDCTWIYETSPVSRMRANFICGGILEHDPSKFWELYSGSVGITKDEFDGYFKGKRVAYGLVIKNLNVIDIPLQKLREIWFPGFEPPQGYYYLSNDQVVQLQEYLQTND